MVTVRENIVSTLKRLGYLHGPFALTAVEAGGKYRSDELISVAGSNTDWHNHTVWWLPTQADGDPCALADAYVRVAEYEPETGTITPDRNIGVPATSDRFYLMERTNPDQMIDITNGALRRNRRVGDIIFRDVTDTFQIGAYTFPIANQPGLSLRLYDGSIVPNVFEDAQPGTDIGSEDPNWTTSDATQVISPNSDSTGLVYSLNGLSAVLSAAGAYIRTVAVALPGGSQQLSAQVALRGSGRAALRIETLTSGDAVVQTSTTEYVDLNDIYWRGPQIVGMALGATEVKARASIVAEAPIVTVQVADLMGNVGSWPVPYVASVKTGPVFENPNALRDLFISGVGNWDQRVWLQGGDVLMRGDFPFLEFGHRLNTGRAIIVHYKAPLAPVDDLDTVIDLGPNYMIAGTAVEFWSYQMGRREGAVRGEADFEYQRWVAVWNREHKLAVGTGSDIARRLRV